MARVFLSHSSRDNASAARIKTWLIEQGFDVPFLDFDKHAGIPPGANWEQTLYREIERSQALLIVQTANWSASRWCFAEFTQARALGKPIFQVIESVDAEPGDKIARDLQVLDLRRDREAGLEQLSQQLTALALSAQGGLLWDGSRPPYPGLLSFEEEDAPVYFGRDDAIRHLIERLTARRTLGFTRLLVLLGASGSGKSSLLRAGVLPRLKRAGRGWLVVPPFRPQSQPSQELARVLALACNCPSQWRELHQSLIEADSDGSLAAVLAGIAADLRMAAGANEAQILLTIDQAEELFSGQDQPDIQRFYRILSSAMADDLPFLAVMTLRSDFLGRLQAAGADGLSARFEEVSLGPLPMAQIPEIIQGPARVAGLELEDAFVQAATADAATEDALPLLAFALRELWDRFGRDGRLTLASYQALGDSRADLSPLENAVSTRADAVLAAMEPGPEERSALRQAFVPAMVRLEQGDYVRRPALWEALPRLAWPLLEQLVNARLLITRQQEDQRLLEVAHEALLRKWPLLRGWLDEDREFLIGSQQLELDLQDWQRAPEAQRSGALLNGLKLQRAKAWLAERPQQLSPELQRFIQASADRADAQQRRSRRQRRLLVGGLSTLSTLAVIGGLTAWRQAAQARAADYASRAELLVDSDPVGSMVHALAALDHQSEAEAFATSQTLAAATGRNRLIATLPTGQGAVLSLISMPNGDLISGGQDGSLRRWRDGQALGPAIPTGQGAVTSLLALRNGDVISGGSNGSLRRWRQDRPLGPPLATGQGTVLSLVEFRSGVIASGGSNGSLRYWRNDRPMGTAVPTGQGMLQALLVLRTGELLSGGERGSLQRWHGPRMVESAAATGEGDLLTIIQLRNSEVISGDSHGNLQRWREGKPIGNRIPTGQGAIRSLIELSNGELISGGQNGSLRRWRDGHPVGDARATGQGAVLSLIDQSSGDLISGGADGSLRIWRDGQPTAATVQTGQGKVNSLLQLKNGLLVSGGSDGSLRQWRNGRPVGATIQTDQIKVNSLTEENDGDLISGGDDGTVRRWRNGRPLGPPVDSGQGEVESLIRLRNGDLISGGKNGTLQRWRHGQPVGPAIRTGQASVYRVLELRNGDLVSGGSDGSLRYWRQDRPLGPPIATGQGWLNSLAELHSGELLTAGDNGTLRRWRDGLPVGGPIPTDQDRVFKLIELSNGNVVSGGSDGSLRLWRNGVPLGPGMPTGQGGVWNLLQLRDGVLISAGEDGTLRRFLEPTTAIRQACSELIQNGALQPPMDAVEQQALKTCHRHGVYR